MSLNKTQSNEKALRHLKTVKPYDGWSLDFYTNSTGQEMVMLKRRNAPLYKKGFSCIAYDEGDSKRVIGITSMIGETAKTTFCRGVVLVEVNGDVARDQKEVRVSLKNTSSSGNDDINMVKKEKELNEVKQARRQNVNNTREALRSRQNGSGSSGTAAGISTASPPSLPNLSDQQTSEMARLGMMVIGVLTILRIISSIFFTGYVLLLPLGIMYAMSNCPSEESFDAKKELKRVLRGHHLPENHPEKPKEDWLSSTIARVTASVATELATSLGYELSFVNLFGICNVVTVNVPIASKEFYWIGIFGAYRYMLSRDLPKTE